MIPNRPKIGNPVSFQEAERIWTEFQIRRSRRRRQVNAAHHHRVGAPDEQNDHHHGGDLHNAQSLVARLLDALDVLPPVIDGDRRREHRGGVVHVELERLAVRVHQRRRQPVAVVRHRHHLVHQAGDVLAGRYARDGSREDVVEHQRRDAEFGEGAAQGLFHHAVDAAAREHRAAFHVHRAYGKAEQHDAENEPGRGGANRLFGDAAGIKGRGAKIIEDDGGGTPEGDEREHHGGCHDEPDAV